MAVISFSHDGMAITNPFADDSGHLNPVEPSFYGFEVWQTGGGCTAWGKKLENGNYILITGEGGGCIPEEDDAPESILIGLYDGETGEEIEIGTLAEALAQQDDEQAVQAQSMSDQDISRLAQEALDAAALLIQNRLGVRTGDLAGIFFSGGEIERRFEEYIRAEIDSSSARVAAQTDEKK